MSEVVVLFFATFRDLAGSDKKIIDLPDGSTVKDLKLHLQEEIPNLASGMDYALIAINREYAFDEDIVPEGAEIAVFPPVSGGVEDAYPTIVSITRDEIDLNNVLSKITLPTTGAVCFFTGVVRELTSHKENQETLALEYKAYQSMAEAKLLQVVQEIRSRFQAVEGIAIVQRIGCFSPGSPTVIIACSASHRDTGVFDAAKYGIDRLKEIVPVWKKEIFKSDESWVEGDYSPDERDKNRKNNK